MSHPSSSILETRHPQHSSRGESGDVDSPTDTEKKSDGNNTSTPLNQAQDDDAVNEVASSEKSYGILDTVTFGYKDKISGIFLDLVKAGLSGLAYLVLVTVFFKNIYEDIPHEHKIPGLAQVIILGGFVVFALTGVVITCRQSIFGSERKEAQKDKDYQERIKRDIVKMAHTLQGISKQMKKMDRLVDIEQELKNLDARVVDLDDKVKVLTEQNNTI